MPTMNFTTFLLTSATILIVTIISITILRKSKQAGSKLPPGPWKLPIIGNIHQLLIRGQHPHRRFKELAEKYAPDVMHIQLGELSLIVISSPEAAKQVMKTHDLAFASRPSSLLASYILGYGNRGVGFAPYGEHWRQMRKICVLELLSVKRVLSFRRVREGETAILVESLLSAGGDPEPTVDLSSMLSKLSSSVTSRAMFGKVEELTDGFLVLVDDITDVLAGFRMSDLYPSVKWLPGLTGFRAQLERIHKASDLVLQEIIDGHQLKRRARKLEKLEGDDDDGEKEDLLDVLLGCQEKQEHGVPITMDVVKAIVMDMFFAGIETSTTAMEWIMSEMIKNQRVLQTAQEEVRRVFCETRIVEEASLHQLNYLDMVISEGLRLHPPAPLLVPRENVEMVELEKYGYEIPKKSRVIVNAWAISRDPRYWTDPERFYPERFADCSTDYKGNDFQFIPFGAGRRMCPGSSFGMAIIKLTLANLLFHFDWRVPDGVEQGKLDMTESFAAVLTRKHPLFLIPVPFRGKATKGENTSNN